MAKVDIVSMKPEDILPVDANVTDTVKEAFPLLIEKSIAILKTHGVEVTKKATHTSLDTIIHTFANPTMPTHDHRS
jgi:hypothetical protein